MSYNSVAEMAATPSLINRIAAAAATQGIENPSGWAGMHMWEFAASPGWGDKWDTARANWSINVNPDIGIRTDVITDDDILAAVQEIRQPEVTP
jgi:hypothetical protein